MGISNNRIDPASKKEDDVDVLLQIHKDKQTQRKVADIFS